MNLRENDEFLKEGIIFPYFFPIFAQKMAKQTLVFESAKELSLSNGMLAITDKETGDITFRSLEDIQIPVS